LIKCVERKIIYENEVNKNIIEKLNIKLNKLKVLPIRKCVPRFKPKDNTNFKNGSFNSKNFKKKNEEELHDFLDII